MRANLLPRPKERINFASIDLDAQYVRQALLAVALVALVALAGIGVETLRVARLEAAAAQQDAAIAVNVNKRAEIKALALEVARYQSFEREAQAFRRSGADVAVALARIGNSIPDRVWLTSLQHQTAGYDVVGGARSVDQLGGTVLALGRALPRTRSTLVNIDNRSKTGVQFTARVGAAPPAPDVVPRTVRSRSGMLVPSTDGSAPDMPAAAPGGALPLQAPPEGAR
ncbi:MAG: hypothetical protein NVS2B3_08280 [Vulcanimicrobiaceae bacterium]